MMTEDAKCELCGRAMSRTDKQLSEMCSDGPICTPCFEEEERPNPPRDIDAEADYYQQGMEASGGGW